MSGDDRPLLVALDVGGTRVKWGVVNPRTSDVVASGAEFSNANGDHDEVLAALGGALNRAATTARDLGPVEFDAAVAFPAPFDYLRGVPLLEHKFASIHGIDLGQSLRANVAGIREVSFWNDAQAAAVGEARHGAAHGFRRALVITLGTGVGSALVVDGQPVDRVGSWSVGDLWREDTPAGRIDDRFSVVAMCEAVGITPPDLRSSVDDSSLADAFDRFGVTLGSTLAPYAERSDADVVVVAGGGAIAFPALERSLRSSLPCPARPSMLGDRAALLGVSDLHLEAG